METADPIWKYKLNKEPKTEQDWLPFFVSQNLSPPRATTKGNR
jgi:hypothetical protein